MAAILMPSRSLLALIRSLLTLRHRDIFGDEDLDMIFGTLNPKLSLQLSKPELNPKLNPELDPQLNPKLNPQRAASSVHVVYSKS